MDERRRRALRPASMRKEDLGFVARAPVRHVFTALVRAPRAAVFAAIADPPGWPAWFPGVRSARYASPPPHGVGSIREADVSGTRWVEEMIAWDEGRRWAYTVTEASTPLASAQVEVFEVADAPDETLADGTPATRVTWTLAIEPRLLQKLTGPIAPLVMRRVFERAMTNLEARLRGAAGASRAAAGSGTGAAVGGFDVDRWTTRLNPLVVRLLRSPLHHLIGGGLMLITVTGRRTGRRYTIPVGYQRDGDLLHVLVSKAARKQWWRNFRTPATLEVELRGDTFAARGHVVDPQDERFFAVIEATLRRLPMLARQFGIVWNPRAGLDAEQRAVLSRGVALVEITRAGGGDPRDA
ncbi:nitroreductase/quinone reductase family protein [Candidatus Binatia bacterium]|nr:nitroreductase/quinone reductase family protein [Candidatus Binatia bacterium]